MDAAALKHAIGTVAAADDDVASTYSAIGLPAPRQSKPSFASLTRILTGQQLSVKAATSIYGRFEGLFDGDVTPKKVLAAPHSALRSVGLSNAKARYCHSLAQAVAVGRLEVDTLPALSENEATAQLTAVKGIGPWTAQIYLLFCEGRADVWPAGDLALQEALKRLKMLKERPSAKDTLPLVAPWKPYRGAMAIFLWHYYAASDAPV